MSGLAYHLHGIALALLIILLYGNQSLLEREGGGWQTRSLSMVQPLQTQEGNRVERHSRVICLHVRKPVGRVWPEETIKSWISRLPDKAYICAGANLKLAIDCADETSSPCHPPGCVTEQGGHLGSSEKPT